MSARPGYRIPGSRIDRVRDVVRAVEDAHRVVLTTHMNADGDGAGCEVAMAAWLRAREKAVRIVNPTPFPGMYSFLLEDTGLDPEGLLVDVGSRTAREACRTADVAVVLDTGEKPRLGRVKPLLDTVSKIVIDHHPPGDAPLEGLSLRDEGACATGELVYDVFLAADDGIGGLPVAAARGLYVAILTDTGSFRYTNTRASTHRMAADLLDRGVDPGEIFRNVYATAPVRRYELLKEALEHLEVDEDHRVAWITVPREAYERLGATSDDLEGVVEYPRSIEGVEVALIFRETGRGETKISFRSNGPVDVNEIATRFGGGGHRKAAGALVDDPLSKVRERALEAAREAVAGTVEGRDA